MPFIPDSAQGPQIPLGGRGFVPDTPEVQRQERIKQQKRDLIKSREESARINSPLGQVGAFTGSLIGGLGNAFLKQPARFAASTVLAPIDLARQTYGAATGKNIKPIQTNIPLIGQTFQGEAAGTQEDIIEGKRPLSAGLKPFYEVPLAAVEAVGTTKALTSLGGAAKKQMAKNAVNHSKKTVQNAIDAVNPNLKGKKLAEGYKDVVFGKRSLGKPGLIAQQELSATDDVKKLGERLSGVLKSKDPLSNLESLGKERVATESKIQEFFRRDPELVYNADKPGLFSKLREAQTKIPREFASIRDSKTVFNSVMKFAENVAQEADDTVPGLRNARMLFDRQAKLEYPNAFKEGGYIDMKTPAGRAIKLARDVFNDHLYSTAPKGSELKALIGREADIFKAADYIGPKAAELHGLNSLQKLRRLFEEHPIAASTITAVGGLTGLSALGNVVNAATKD